MNPEELYSDSDILEGLKSDPVSAERFEYIFFRRYAYFISHRPRKYALTNEGAADAYTEAFLAVVDHVRSGRFRGDSSLKTYLSRIFRNKCVDQFRKNTTVKADWVDEFPDLPDESRDILRNLYGRERWLEVREALEDLGDKCRDLLLKSAEGFSPAELAAAFGFKTPRSASTQRYKCLEKLKQLLISREAF